jgi:pyridoxine/pyridoxamine 5'-phosphate oxidase
MADELDAVLDDIWRLLGRGSADRRSPVHTPVVASVGADGAPDARVMVLRAADRVAATLRFHTDARSPKCAALDGRPVSVLAYHPGEAVQLRIGGTAQVLRDGPTVDAIWQAATPFARRCYMVEAAPGSARTAAGSGLPADVEGRKPTLAELRPARAHFALVLVSVATIDWLHLAQTGHRRARFSVTNGWQGEWLVP